MKQAQRQFRSFSDPLERQWMIWDLNNEKIDVIADRATYSQGVLALYCKDSGQVATFREFKTALQAAHADFGFPHYWVNDGTISHVVEANHHSWHDNGNNVFIQTDYETKTERLIAVFPHAAWWVRRENRMLICHPKLAT